MFFKSNRKSAIRPTPLVLDVAPAPGFFAGTELGTRYTWAKVETLEVGDTVLTAENGEQEIVGLERGELSLSSHAAAAGHWPLMVPEGALGNEKRMMVSPGMRVVIEDDAAGALFGHNCVSVQAANLVGYKGIARARVARSLIHVTLVFDKPQTLVAQGGAMFDVPDMGGVQNFMPLNDRHSRLLIRQMGEADRRERGRTVSPAWI